jgi:lysophospholipase L1-like esterase
VKGIVRYIKGALLMRLSKWLVGAVSTLNLLGMSPGVAMAATQSETRVGALPQKQLVALGDSISYGYNLGPNNNQPSTYTFPYLIGEATNEKVQDLSVRGATSSDLLNLLQTSLQVDAAVREANTVTIDIGSNDLLQVTIADGLISPNPPALTTAEQSQFAAVIQKFSANLPNILAIVHQLAPKANVVLYNLYDPFSSQTVPALHALAKQMIAPEN